MFIDKNGSLLIIFFWLFDNPNEIDLLFTINGLLKLICKMLKLKSIDALAYGWIIVSHRLLFK